MKKKLAVTRNHSIGMPLVRVIPSLAMMTWNKEALKAINKNRDLICRYLGNGRLVLHTAAVSESVSKKINSDRGENGSTTFKLRLVLNKNRAISRTPTNIVEFLRKNHLSGPFIGKAIKGYPALFVNFSEPASGDSVDFSELLEDAPVVKFTPKAPKAKPAKKAVVKKAKPKKAAKKAKPAKEAKAAKPKKVASVKKVTPPAPKPGATIREKAPKPEPDTVAAGVVEEDEELSAPIVAEEAEEEGEQDWAESLEEVAAEEEEGDDTPSPIRATTSRRAEEE